MGPGFTDQRASQSIHNRGKSCTGPYPRSSRATRPVVSSQRLAEGLASAQEKARPAMFSYRCSSAGPHALCRAAGLSRLTEEDRSLLSANATLSSQLAADGDAGDHSPFARSLLKNFDGEPTPLYARHA